MATCHRALLPADMPLSQSWQSVPEPKGHGGYRNSSDSTCHLPKMRPAVMTMSIPSASAKGEKRQLGNHRRQTMEMFANLAVLGDAVIGTGRNQ